jgi:dTDP-4-amino-4,6-dideoxygalactose transaminase
MSKLAILGGAPVRSEPFSPWPHADGRERAWVEKVLSGSRWFAGARGDDPESLGSRFGARFASLVGVRFGLPVANGSVSLEIALRALGIGPGDEVIVPAYTFVSTATSVLMVGAVPVFADIDPGSYCLDVRDCARRITPRTRALIPVHLGGQMADMSAIAALAEKHGLAIVEDSAQAIDARWDNRPSGSWGAYGSFSFQANKTITSGEGGLLATDDPDLAEKASAFRAFGRFTTPGAATAGRSSGLLSQRLSGNYRLSEIQAAVLLGQLERFPEEDAARQENAAQLTRLLAQMPGVRHVRVDRERSKHAYYYYVIQYDPARFAGVKPAPLARALAAEGIPFVPGDAMPTYRHPVFRAENLAPSLPAATLEHYRKAFDLDNPGCPNAESACERTLILRHQVLLAPAAAMAQIAEALAKVQACAGELAAQAAGVPA